MNKLTLQGISVPAVVGAITAVFMAVFHKSLNADIVAFLPFVVTTIAGYFGVRFAANKASQQLINR